MAYPSVNEVNIPDQVELTRILGIIGSREEVIKDTEPQRREAEADVETLRQLVEDQERILKENQYKLKTAEELLKKLEKRMIAAQEDLNALQGRMHPIRRCPTDILQHIFEWAVTTRSVTTWFKHATNLSQVCYRWRLVALQTSTLWTHITIPLGSNSRKFEDFWTWTVERIKKCPAVITFEADDDAICEAMKRYLFEILPQIKQLTFRFTSDDAVKRFTGEELNLTSTPIKRLTIESHWKTPQPYQVLRIHPSLIIDRFSVSHEVVLGDFDFTNFTANFTHPNVSKLVIRRSRNVHLGLFAQVFPNVDILKILHVQHAEPGEENIKWPKVKAMWVDSEGILPWRLLKLPNIVDLYFSSEHPDDGFTSFLTSHQSLQHLDLLNSSDYISKVAESAPQLISFSMAIHSSIDTPKLPKGLSLELYQGSNRDLPCWLFERIVREYFLPDRNLTGCPENADRSSRSLTILIDVEEEFEPEWRQCPLLMDAVRKDSVTNQWYSAYNSYSFQWK